MGATVHRTDVGEAAVSLMGCAPLFVDRHLMYGILQSSGGERSIAIQFSWDFFAVESP
jgi:hypothetical protein